MRDRREGEQMSATELMEQQAAEEARAEAWFDAREAATHRTQLTD